MIFLAMFKNKHTRCFIIDGETPSQTPSPVERSTDESD